MRCFRLAMVQMNPVLGDLEGNARAIKRWLSEARKARVDAVVFPELAVTGYPPEDLLLKSRFLKDTARVVERIVRESRGVFVVLGCPAGGRSGKIGCTEATMGNPQELYNAAAIVADGRIVGIYAKQHLPNYGVFDEQRYFHPGTCSPVYVVKGIVVGVNICEDIWHAEGPTRDQVRRGGAELILNINASPYQAGKRHVREELLSTRAREYRALLSYTNMVGGQDELVFDGNSLLVDAQGRILDRASAFQEDLLIADLDMEGVRGRRNGGRSRFPGERTRRTSVPRIIVSALPLPTGRTALPPHGWVELDPLEEIYRALLLGVRDYVRKNRFEKVLIGISGGIDSALTALVARDAIGAEQVIGVLMPSPYTSLESREDSRQLARNLRMKLLTIPISGLFAAYLRRLRRPFAGCPTDTTEENLQARIRGNILMALSNKFGYLVLTTGNKSEMSVGYATLYGDMAGGFAVIKDVPKTLVYELAAWRSTSSRADLDPVAVPRRIQERAPSAELKPGQKDQDTLPPYPVLDAILKAYIEDNQSPEEIASLGFSLPVVKQVVAMVDKSEYKRRQAPIGIKITARAFGKDHRMPITNRYPHS